MNATAPALAPACFTVQQLAARWACHRSHIYRMIDAGEIAPFRIGTLIRIPTSEVERIECPQIPPLPSNDSGVDGPSNGSMPKAGPTVTSCTRPIGLGQRPKPAGDGRPGTVLPGRWGGR
jgi:excisionase family DNA binding protein